MHEPAPFRVTIVQSDAWSFGQDEATAAITAAKGEVVARLGWDATEAPPTCDVVVLHAESVAEDTIADVLPRLLTTDAALILTLAASQIDLVGVLALDSDAQLLCDPSPVDWAIALAVARGGFGADAAVREGESARIARINAEIARIADQLVRLSRAEPPTDAVADRNPDYDAGPNATAPVTAAEIRQLIRARRLRDKQFGAGLFEDPAWDMMLDLFAARLEKGEVSVSSLCIAAAVAPTTALRWIARLTAAGLLVRAADPFDRRRALMSLSDRAWQGMRNHVASVRAQGLPLA